MTLQFRALAALAEDLGSVSGSDLPVLQFQGTRRLLASAGPACVYDAATHMQEKYAYTENTHKVIKSEKIDYLL